MDLFHYNDDTPRKGHGYFWWALALLLLTGACFASWLGSFYIVGHPEEPRCYRILKKAKRLDSPKRFYETAELPSGVKAKAAKEERVKVPKGEFLTAKQALERFGKLGPVELANANTELLRAYLMNYRETRQHVFYLVGKFDSVETYPLTQSDFFPSGVALLAQSLDLPQVLLENLFIAPAKTVPAIRDALPIGGDITLERSRDLCALVHVERIAGGRMQFTTVPLLYAGWQVKNGRGSFSLKSPEELEKEDAALGIKIEATLPVVRAERLQKGLDTYSDHRRKTLANAKDDEAALAGPELVRFEPARGQPSEVATALVAKLAAPTPAPAPTPPPPRHPPLITAPPAARPIPTPAPAVPLVPRAIVRATPAPVPTPAPIAVAVATPKPPEPIRPARRAVSTSEASLLVETFAAAEPAVLSGDFVVTGIRGQRVALRTRESLRDPNADPTKPGTSAALIVVDYPEGVAPPPKDTILSRDATRGFAIRDVIRGKGEQITIVAAEEGQ